MTDHPKRQDDATTRPVSLVRPGRASSSATVTTGHVTHALRPEQVAALLRVTSKTVGRWANSGVLRFSRTLGGHRRFFVGDVLSFADASGREIDDASLRALGVDLEVARRPPLPLDVRPVDWDLNEAVRRVSEQGRAVIILDSEGCEILLSSGARVLDPTFAGAVWKAQRALSRVA